MECPGSSGSYVSRSGALVVLLVAASLAGVVVAPGGYSGSYGAPGAGEIVSYCSSWWTVASAAPELMANDEYLRYRHVLLLLYASTE